MNANIHEKALLVRLGIGMFSPTKRDKSATSEVLLAKHATTGSAEVRKRLVPKDAIGPIEKLAREIRSYHYANTLPWNDEGLRLLPVANWQDYSDGMRGHRYAWDKLVDKFCNEYAQHRQQAMVQLGLLFDAKDYPAVEEVRTRFQVLTDWLPLPMGDDFRLHMNDEDLEALRSELDTKVAEASATAKKDLYVRLAEKLKHVSERLADPDNIFRDSLIEGLRELCRLIPNLNLHDDPVLEGLRKEALTNIARHDPQSLRDDDTARESAKSAADAILRKMGYAPSAPLAMVA